MRKLLPLSLALLLSTACGGAQSPQATPDEGAAATSSGDKPAGAEETADGKPERIRDSAGEFETRDSATSKDAHGTSASKIKATATEAALKFVVVDKDKGPITGIVVSLTAPDGKKYFTGETDATGYAEVLVPVGQKYSIVYLALGRRDIESSVTVTGEPNQNIKLTLRYKRHGPEPTGPERVALKGVKFDTGRATIRPESFPELDRVVEYLTHKPSVRIEVSGHTDNQGNPKTNKSLSEKRAQACRDYMISKGIDGARIQAVGYGDERPIAPNDNEEGRQLNRRIEATEI